MVPAKEVKDGPIFENIVDGDKIDTFAFPSPKFYELDGGRYFGTAVFMTIQDPDTGDMNLGTYRMGVLDSKTVGVQLLKGKKGDRILKKYGKKGKKMPACAIIGGDPLHIFAGAATVPGAKSGYDVVGTLRGSPVEVVKGQLSGLPIPAAAEIVLEGEIDAEKLRNEGPFGEYTGYYTEELIKPIPKPALEVKRVYYRNNPILWETSVGRPVGDQHMLYAFVRNASLWTELTKMKIPGIKTVYTMPEASGRFWVVISVQQMYPGHADQVAAAVIASNTGTYGIKGIISWTTISVRTIFRECGGLSARGTTPAAARRLLTEAGPLPSILPLGRTKTSSSPHGSSWMRRSPLTGRSNPRRSSSRRASWPK